MAPAVLVAHLAATREVARWVDLDAPLLLARDRADGLVYVAAVVQPPTPALWG